MFFIRLFCAFYLIHYAICNPARQPFMGIMGGHTISISRTPYMASLVRIIEKTTDTKAKRTICGGTIIHERFVLTAAHCLLNKSTRDIIRVGSKHLNSGGATYEVEKYIPHENFSIVGFQNDIALLKLNQSLNFSETVAKISLADENFNTEPLTLVNVTGWDQTMPGSHVSMKLRQVQLEIRPVIDCKTYPWVADDALCTWAPKKGSCKGDSGGPMTMGNVQIGISSHGIVCGYLPVIYTRVSYYVSWINDTINKNL